MKSLAGETSHVITLRLNAARYVLDNRQLVKYCKREKMLPEVTALVLESLDCDISPMQKKKSLNSLFGLLINISLIDRIERLEFLRGI